MNEDAAPSGEGSAAPLWLLTGPGAAGRSTALDALRRAGVACTDDLPIPLLAAAAALPRDRPAVVAVDSRRGREIVGLTPPAGVRVLYLDADDRTLVRRLADSTAPHPCADAGGAPAAVRADRDLLASLRAVADAVIDTSDLTPGLLGERVVALIRPDGAEAAGHGLLLTISSFGFKHGPEVEADWGVDVRFLPNPFWEPDLRPLTGLDRAVRDHVLDNEDGRQLVDRLAQLLGWVAERSVRRGRHRLHVAIGCTGGRHRSVAVSEELGRRLAEGGLAVVVRHRDLDRPDPR